MELNPANIIAVTLGIMSDCSEPKEHSYELALLQQIGRCLIQVDDGSKFDSWARLFAFDALTSVPPPPAGDSNQSYAWTHRIGTAAKRTILYFVKNKHNDELSVSLITYSVYINEADSPRTPQDIVMCSLQDMTEAQYANSGLTHFDAVTLLTQHFENMSRTVEELQHELMQATVRLQQVGNAINLVHLFGQS
jgi:hypothetical protein